MTKRRYKEKDNYGNIDISELAEDINHWPPRVRPKRTDTKRHVIEQLREPLLDALLTRGYSYAQLVTLLKQRGLTIHISTLRKYLGPLSQQRNVPSVRVPAGNADSQTVGMPQPVVRPALIGDRDRVTVADQSRPPAGKVDRPSHEEVSSSRSGRFVPLPEIPLDKL